MANNPALEANLIQTLQFSGIYLIRKYYTVLFFIANHFLKGKLNLLSTVNEYPIWLSQIRPIILKSHF